MSDHCPDCFSSRKEHHCPCSPDRLASLKRLSFKDWDASIHLIVYFSERRNSILLLQYAEQHSYEDEFEERFERSGYPHYIEVPIDDLIPYHTSDTEALTRRAKESFVFGRSNAFEFDLNVFEMRIPAIASKIQNELAIKNLANNERGITDEGGSLDLTFRFSKEYKTFIEMGNGFSVLIGSKEPILELTDKYVRDESFKDAAYALLAVPFHCLLGNKNRVIDKLREKAKDFFAHNNRDITKVDVKFNTKSFKLNLNPYDEDLYTVVSIYWYSSGYDRDTTYFMLPGGKRELGETSWECAMRETREETNLDLRSLVQTPDTASDWTVTGQLGDYYFIAFKELLTKFPGLNSSNPSLDDQQSVIYDEPCWFYFKDGRCPFPACTYRHGGVPPTPSWLSEVHKRPCWHFFEKGSCPFKNCTYSHEGLPPTKEWLAENRPKLCSNFLKGKCRFGGDCFFWHGTSN